MGWKEVEDWILGKKAEEDSEDAVLSKNKDFILDSNINTYDVCCINPPYFKYSSKNSHYAKALAHLFKGDPNIYASFVAKALSLLAPKGELIFITPRSFTNGLYFKGFRKYLLKNNNLDHIHIFKSRKDAFKDTEVLQENVIFKIVKDQQQFSSITISSSDGVEDLNDSQINKYDFNLILDSISNESFIRIPENSGDAEILSLVESLENTFDGMGYFISTGPVVEYRSKEFLEQSDTASLPLINAHNLQDLNVMWDGNHKKDKRFYLVNGADKWLVPNKNYVLIRRISSKDEKRRISAAVYKSCDVKQDAIALENHLNFIGHKDRDMSLEEVYGLALVLRSNLFDTYFRAISGNTQVNATEIKTLKLFSRETIEELGCNWLSGKIEEHQVDTFLEERIRYEPRYAI